MQRGPRGGALRWERGQCSSQRPDAFALCTPAAHAALRSRHRTPPPPFSLPPGDCNFKMEFLRGNWGIREQFKKCVQRRAELSVAMNPYCGQARAEAAVRAVLDRCLRDTAPFDRIP